MGQGRPADHAGTRFGRLLVVRPCERPAGRNSKGRWWLCRCDCGTEVTATSGHLTRTRRPVRSCGCLQVETAGWVAAQHREGGPAWTAEEDAVLLAVGALEAAKRLAGRTPDACRSRQVVLRRRPG